MPAIQKTRNFLERRCSSEVTSNGERIVTPIIAGVSDRDGSRIYNAQAFIDPEWKVIGNIAKRICHSRSARRASVVHGGDAFYELPRWTSLISD